MRNKLILVFQQPANPPNFWGGSFQLLCSFTAPFPRCSSPPQETVDFVRFLCLLFRPSEAQAEANARRVRREAMCLERREV